MYNFYIKLGITLKINILHYLAMLLRRKNDGYVWIGLNDIDREGNFVWADGSPGKGF